MYFYLLFAPKCFPPSPAPFYHRSAFLPPEYSCTVLLYSTAAGQKSLSSTLNSCQRCPHRPSLFFVWTCSFRQDIVWFDEHPAGEMPSAVTSAMAKIQDGIGRKVCMRVLRTRILLQPCHPPALATVFVSPCVAL